MSFWFRRFGAFGPWVDGLRYGFGLSGFGVAPSPILICSEPKDAPEQRPAYKGSQGFGAGHPLLGLGREIPLRGPLKGSIGVLLRDL